MSNDHIYLCAYYVGNHKTEEVLIKNYLAKFLPDYMIPEVFITYQHSQLIKMEK